MIFRVLSLGVVGYFGIRSFMMVMDLLNTYKFRLVSKRNSLNVFGSNRSPPFRFCGFLSMVGFLLWNGWESSSSAMVVLNLFSCVYLYCTLSMRSINEGEEELQKCGNDTGRVAQHLQLRFNGLLDSNQGLVVMALCVVLFALELNLYQSDMHVLCGIYLKIGLSLLVSFRRGAIDANHSTMLNYLTCLIVACFVVTALVQFKVLELSQEFSEVVINVTGSCKY